MVVEKKKKKKKKTFASEEENWIESALGLIEEVNNNMRLQLETDELPIDAADFWFAKNTRAFLTAQAEHFNNRKCDLPLYEVDEKKNEVRCIIRTQPNTYIPSIVKRALGLKKGQSLELYDELKFSKKSETAPKLFEAELVNTNNITKASKVEGIIRCKSVGVKACRMYVDLTIDVKLTGVGRLVESIIAKEVRTMYEGFRPLVEKYIQARRERQMEASLRNSSLAQEMMKSEALAERDAAQLIQMNTIDSAQQQAPGSPSSDSADPKKDFQDETFSNEYSTLNDDFEFMSVNSDLTDLQILESRWKRLEAFETETRQEQDLTGFESRNKCLPSCFSCFSNRRKRKKRALLVDSSTYVEMEL